MTKIPLRLVAILLLLGLAISAELMRYEPATGATDY